MGNVLLLIFFLLIPALSHAATGSAAVDTWYLRPASVCANNGDGLAYACAASPGASGAFISAASSNLVWTQTTGIDDGDTLYICGAHTTPVYVSSSGAGSSTSRITISFACPNDAGSITRITTMTEASTANNWTNESGSLWYLDLSSYTYKDPKRLWLDTIEFFPASVKGNLGATTPFWYDSGNSRLYYYAAANPSTLFTTLQSLVAGSGTCSYAAFCITAEASDYIDVVNPNLIGGNLASLYVLGADYIRIYGTTTDDTSCNIGWHGSVGLFASDTGTDGTGAITSNGLLQNCTIDQGIPVHFTTQDWNTSTVGGNGVALFYGVDQWRITSNTLKDWTHAIVDLVATVGTTSVTNNRIDLNTFSCALTISYCRGFAVDGTAAGRASYNTIEANTFTNMVIRSQLNGDLNSVRGNLFAGQQQSLVAAHQTAVQSLDMEGYTGSVSLNNAIVNNTFTHNTYGPCISFRTGTNTKSGYLVANNLLYDCGGTALVGYEQAALVLQSGASVGNQTFYNNLIYDAAQTSTVFYKATGLTTVSGFQSACSGDTCMGNLSSAPTFLSTTDYRPGSGSPVRAVGKPLGVCLDVRGRVCPSDHPHIGAYQATSGDPAATRAVRN